MAINKASVQLDWIWRLKMEEKNVADRLRTRLNSVRGLLEGSFPNNRDREIQEWTTKRRMFASKALKLKDDPNKLPSLKTKDSKDLPSRLANWPGLQWKHPDLSVYPVLQLPRLASNGRRVSTGNGAMMHSRSEPGLRRLRPLDEYSSRDSQDGRTP